MSGPYNSRWQKARATYLSHHTQCVMCGKDADIVDHIKPHKGNQELFWDTDNWQPLCKHCHDSHKKRLEQSGKVIGCSIDGIPLDARHHWNR